MRFALLCTACLLAAPSAQAAVLNFEDFNLGDPVNSVTFDDGTTATVTTVSRRAGGTNQAIIFDTDVLTGEDTDLVAPIPSVGGGDPISPGNVLIIAENDDFSDPDDDTDGGTITFEFDDVVDLLSFLYIDTEESSGLTVTTDTGFSSGVLMTGDHQYDRFTGAILGVTTITFDFAGSGAIDELEIGTGTTVIPVPASLPLLLAGLGLFGWLGRRRAA